MISYILSSIAQKKGTLLDTYKEENYRQVATPIEDIIRQKGAGSHNILFGDTDHGDNSIPRFLSKPETLKALAETGVAHLCLEAPAALQPLVDDYSSGKTGRAEFMEQLNERFILMHGTKEEQRERRELIADTIDNANKLGIKTHFVDDGAGIQKDKPPLGSAMSEITTEYLLKNNIGSYNGLMTHIEDEKNKKSLQTYLEAGIRKRFPDIPPDENVFDKYNEELYDARLRGDKATADNINKIGSDGKVAILYGAAHGMSGKDDLNENLQGGALTIVLQGKDKDWSTSLKDKPHLVHDVLTGVTTADRENPDLNDLPLAMPAYAAPSNATPAPQNKPVTSPAPVS